MSNSHLYFTNKSEWGLVTRLYWRQFVFAIKGTWQENKNIFHIRFSLSVGNLIDLAALKITRKGEFFVIILPLKISQQVKT